MSDPLRFDAAINPYGCSPAATEALEAAAAAAHELRHYGDPDAGALRRRLAAHHELSPDNFVVYNGSGEGFVWLCLTRLLMPHKTMVCPYPSYERFVDVGRRCATQVVEVPLDPERWTLPIGALVTAVRAHDAALLMISSPNNPTGNRLLDEAQLESLLRDLPGTLVVIDEAYAEYGGLTFARLCLRFPNLVVLKTFSKAYGLAGLRVGYVVAHERAAAAFRGLQIPWSVDTLALAGAEAALGDQPYLRQIVLRIREDVAVFGAALAALPRVRVSPTDANFFLVELGAGGWERLGPRLEAHRMLVRRRADLPDRIRVTCMTPAMNQALLKVMAD
jgi:histidinol-phosphate aminotransferase